MFVLLDTYSGYQSDPVPAIILLALLQYVGYWPYAGYHTGASSLRPRPVPQSIIPNVLALSWHYRPS